MTLSAGAGIVGLVGLALVLGLLVIGWRLSRASALADAMGRHPAGRHRPTTPAVCDVCGWPAASYQHYSECR